MTRRIVTSTLAIGGLALLLLLWVWAPPAPQRAHGQDGAGRPSAGTGTVTAAPSALAAPSTPAASPGVAPGAAGNGAGGDARAPVTPGITPGIAPASTHPADHPKERPHDGPKPPPPPIQPNVEDVVAILREVNPALAAAIEEARQKHPDTVEQMVRDTWPKIARLVELKHRDPESFRLAIEDVRLARQAEDLAGQFRRGTDPAQLTKIKADLKAVVAARFDLKVQLRKVEIARFQKELDAHLRDRDKAIDEDVRRLLAPPTKPTKSPTTTQPTTRPRDG